jgi:hypothetical protein
MAAVIEALDRAIASLNADRALIEKLGVISPDLETDIAILTQLRDEFAAGPREYRERLASHPFDLKKWVEENIPYLRSAAS